jgi:hypothetical protein
MRDEAKLAGVAGLAFVALTAVAMFVSGEEPALDAGAQDIREYLDDSRTTILVAVVLGLLGTVLFLLWAIVARRVAGRGTTGDTAGTALLTGAIVGSVAGLAGDLVIAAPLWIEGDLAETGDELLAYAWSLRFLLYSLSMVGMVLIGAAMAAASLRDRLFPAYVGWVGALAAVLGVVGLFSPLGTGVAMVAYVGYLALLLLVIVASMTMVRGAVVDEPRTRSAAP